RPAAAFRPGQRLALRARRVAWAALPAAQGPGQAGQRARRRGLGRGGRRASRFADLRPVDRGGAERRQQAPLLDPGRLRPRFRDPERNGAVQLRVHEHLRPRCRCGRPLERRHAGDRLASVEPLVVGQGRRAAVSGRDGRSAPAGVPGMTRILLLGADGQLGTELRRSLAPLGDIVAATLSGRLGEDACEAADFSEPGSLQPLVERVAPDIVVNAAAHTAVDRAETERGLAFAINAEAPAVLATACAARGARLVHFSTDYVFDGSATRPYREDDATSPLGVYGHSKRAGELAVLGSGASHLLFRTAWVYAAHS